MPCGMRATSDLKPAQAKSAPTAAPPARGSGFRQGVGERGDSESAKSGTNGKFLLTRGGSGKKKVSDVSATDEKEQTNGSKDNIKSGAKLADDQIGEGLNLHGKVLGIILGVDRGKTVGNNGHIRLGFLHRNAVFQMSQEKPVTRESAGIGGASVRLGLSGIHKSASPHPKRGGMMPMRVRGVPFRTNV